MTSTELKHQARLQEWTMAIQECRGSGLSVRQWCREQGVTTTTYYRWERKWLITGPPQQNRLLEWGGGNGHCFLLGFLQVIGMDEDQGNMALIKSVVFSSICFGISSSKCFR